MKRFALLFLFFILTRVAFSQGDLRILIRGQEMAFNTLTVRDDLPYISVDDKSWADAASLLGGEKGPVPPPEKKEFSLRELGKLYNASVTFDSERNIWYVDPWVSGASITAANDKTAVQIQSTLPIQPTITRLESPPRIVLDFPYATLSENVSLPAPATEGLVEKVEIAQFQSKPNIVRVVLHLKESSVQWATEVDPLTKALSVVVSVMPSPALQPGTEAQHSPSILGGVEVKTVGEGEDQKLVASLKFSSPAAFAWRKLRSPDNRIYIDFLDCLQGTAKSMDLDNPYFQVIRVSQFQRVPVAIVRVVFQLREAYHVEVQTSSEGLDVSVSSRVEEAGEVLSGGGTTGFSESVAGLSGGRFSPHGPSRPNGIVLVLDPGHGGKDPGARGRVLVEKEVTLDIAERLREKLVENGFTVFMTRAGDQDVLGYHGSAKAELQARVDVVKRTNAKMLISLHINSSDYAWPRGVQSHWYKSMDLPLATAVQKSLGEVAGFTDRGIVRDRFYVLHHSTVPSTLVEMGFISNSGDEALLEDSAVRNQLAEAICRGIVEYSGLERHVHL